MPEVQSTMGHFQGNKIQHTPWDSGWWLQRHFLTGACLKWFMQDVGDREERFSSHLSKFWICNLQRDTLLGASTKTSVTFVYPLSLSIILPKHMGKVLQGVAFSVHFFSRCIIFNSLALIFFALLRLHHQVHHIFSLLALCLCVWPIKSLSRAP